MTFTFDTYEEYAQVQQTAHDAILYWKKQLQAAQGKITLNCDGSPSHYSEEYCVENIKSCALVLKNVEDSTHPDYVYNEDEYGYTISTTHVIVDGTDAYSCILYKTLGKDLTPTGGKIIETLGTEYE